MTRAIHHVYPKIEYYYMGYYVHSCPKMRYKVSVIGVHFEFGSHSSQI